MGKQATRAVNCAGLETNLRPCGAFQVQTGSISKRKWAPQRGAILHLVAGARSPLYLRAPPPALVALT